MFVEIKLSSVFLCNTGKAGHISTAVWDAEQRGPLACTMQIYENDMQISIVLVIQKQTNKWQEREWLVCLLEDSWLLIGSSRGVYVCICVYLSVCVCMHACSVTEEKQWHINAPRKLALQLFAFSWVPRTPSLVRNNNYYRGNIRLWEH